MLHNFFQTKKYTPQLYKKFLYILIIYALLFFCILPFLVNSPRAGHDTTFHLGRIAAIADQLYQGILYSKINYWYGNGIGYAASLGYPDLFLYIPAFFVTLGTDIKSSYQLFLLLCSVLTFLSSYISFRCFNISQKAVLIGTLIYCISPYHLYCMLVRSALGEIQAFIFFPMIIAGTYSCIHKNNKEGYLLFLGFSGIVLSHVISSLIAIIIFLLYICIELRHLTFKNTKFILRHLLLSMAITSFFWMPLLEFYITNDLCMHHALHTTDIYAGSITSLFIPSLSADNLFFGLPIYIAAFFTLSRYQCPKISIFLFCIGAFIVIATTDIFSFWKSSIFSVIQFPWRLYGIASLFIAISFLFLAEHNFTIKKYDKLYYSTAAVVLMSNILILAIYITTSPHTKPISNIEFGGGSEFLPYASRQLLYTRQDIKKYIKEEKPLDPSKDIRANFFYNPSADNLIYEHEAETTRIRIPDSQYITKIHTRLLCYSGYKAYATDSSGEIFYPEIQINKQDGFCDLLLNREFEGTISIQYESSTIQKLSYFLTIISCIFLAIDTIVKVFKKILCTVALHKSRTSSFPEKRA